MLEEHAVTSQDQLVELLASDGVVASQVTVSRDLEELGAVKVRMAGGETVYAIPELPKDRVAPESHLKRVLGEWLVEVSHSANLVVLRTPPGSAHVVGSAIDRAGLADVLGSVAGDDTVLVVCSERVGGEAVARRLSEGVPDDGIHLVDSGSHGERHGRGDAARCGARSSRLDHWPKRSGIKMVPDWYDGFELGSEWNKDAALYRLILTNRGKTPLRDFSLGFSGPARVSDDAEITGGSVVTQLSNYCEIAPPVGFERPDLLADGRLGDKVPLRCQRKALKIDEIAENF